MEKEKDGEECDNMFFKTIRTIFRDIFPFLHVDRDEMRRKLFGDQYGDEYFTYVIILPDIVSCEYVSFFTNHVLNCCRFWEYLCDEKFCLSCSIVIDNGVCNENNCFFFI